MVIREANKADVQTTVARDANGEYVLTLKGGQPATLLDVLYGTTATVAEDAYTAARLRMRRLRSPSSATSACLA